MAMPGARLEELKQSDRQPDQIDLAIKTLESVQDLTHSQLQVGYRARSAEARHPDSIRRGGWPDSTDCDAKMRRRLEEYKQQYRSCFVTQSTSCTVTVMRFWN